MGVILPKPIDFHTLNSQETVTGGAKFFFKLNIVQNNTEQHEPVHDCREIVVLLAPSFLQTNRRPGKGPFFSAVGDRWFARIRGSSTHPSVDTRTVD